jgi:CBS domain-containing protein
LTGGGFSCIKMTTDLRTSTLELPLAKVLDILRVNRGSGLPVVEDSNLVGILSIEDIVWAMMKNELDAPADQYMTCEV